MTETNPKTESQSSTRFQKVVTGGSLILLSLMLAPLSVAEELPPLFPFLISYDAPDNASSVAHMLDAPAGKHGFIRVKDGRFVNDGGPVRLHATNLTGPANFPTHEQARLEGHITYLGQSRREISDVSPELANAAADPARRGNRVCVTEFPG